MTTLHGDHVSLHGDRVSLRGDRVSLHGDRVSLRGDHMQFRVLLQTACHTHASSKRCAKFGQGGERRGERRFEEA